MTVTTTTTLSFADGTYKFFLPLPQLYELEGKHGSVAALEAKLRQSIGLDEKGTAVFSGGGEAEARAIRDVIRCALIGAGKATVDGERIEVGPQSARDLVDRYVYPARPLGEAAAIAWRILAGVIYGNPLDDASTEAPGADAPPAKAEAQSDE